MRVLTGLNNVTAGLSPAVTVVGTSANQLKFAKATE